MAETGGEEAAAGVDKEVGGEPRNIWNQEVEKQQLQKESSPRANAKQAKALDWPQGAQSAMAAASYREGQGAGLGGSLSSHRSWDTVNVPSYLNPKRQGTAGRAAPVSAAQIKSLG